MTPLFPIAPLESLVLPWNSSMSSELLLVRVSSDHADRSSATHGPAYAENRLAYFVIRNTASHRARLVHDDHVIWVLLERDELRPILEEESWVRSSERRN